MAISKLADTAVRAIGASQVLTDPSALVKELLENALDAHATSVAIEIHNNSLDVIQVRDNGHGIAPEDRSMVARPNCTSKLVDIDDLKQLGGSSLGFRGQALASAAEMSGSMTISTRVEGEEVATALKINQRGEVHAQERASLPVGTTVRITDFIKANPVRRQVALKNAERCLKKIKQTLQAYAFARPTVRLSLRVLKAKHDKGSWTFAPKPGGTLDDAALKIVGSACVSQCTWTVVEQHGFTLQAFLPRLDADVGKISNIGAYISVDARPVSAARGTLKQVVKIFRDALKAASSAFEGAKEPFVCMQILCPTASYDPNVEPAKDDVLFEDPDRLVEAARQLFLGVYPPLEAAVVGVTHEPNPEKTLASIRPNRQAAMDEDDFVTSLEPQRTPVRASPAAQDTLVDAFIFERPRQLGSPLPTSDFQVGEDLEDDRPAKRQRTWRPNMYGCDEEDLDLLDVRPPTGRTEAGFEELRQANNDVTVSNPWVVAKMNARRRPAADDDGAPRIEERPSRDVTSSLPTHQGHAFQAGDELGLPTPRPSSPSPPAHRLHPSDHLPDIHSARDGRHIGSQSLPPPQALMRVQRELSESGLDDDMQFDQPSRQRPEYNYGLLSQDVQIEGGIPLSSIPDVSNRPRRSPQKKLPQSRLNKPFVPLTMSDGLKEKVWFDHLEEEGRSRPKPKRPSKAHDSDGLVRQGELGDLIDGPRPLTPPRRNRDIRDFVASVDLTGADSADSLIERRNYSRVNPSPSVDAENCRPSLTADEHASPMERFLSGPTFIPASELAAMEARMGPMNKAAGRPPKRRKTSESQTLRQISGNATAPTEDEEEYRPVTSNRTGSRRRRTTDGKVPRTKSSRLPLERVPKGQGMQNVEYTLNSSVRAISRCAGKLDEEASLLGWNQPAIDAYEAFSSELSMADMENITMKLSELLVENVSDGEMVQDLGTLVKDAVAAHVRKAMSGDGESAV